MTSSCGFKMEEVKDFPFIQTQIRQEGKEKIYQANMNNQWASVIILETIFFYSSNKRCTIYRDARDFYFTWASGGELLTCDQQSAGTAFKDNSGKNMNKGNLNT